MKMEERIEDKVKLYNSVEMQITETEKRLQELKDAREQIRGQVTLLQELADEEKKNGQVQEEAVAGEVVDN